MKLSAEKIMNDLSAYIDGSHEYSTAYHNGFCHFGLRALTDGQDALSVGDDLPNSYDWAAYDAAGEEVELAGTSTIGLTDDYDSIESAISAIDIYDNSHGYALVVGCEHDYGQDDGEAVLSNAFVLARY